MGARLERARRALTVGRVAHQSGLRRILAEIGVAGRRDATLEGAQSFRRGLEELGTTFIKLGQLLSSRPDLLPDVYIDELGGFVDAVPAVPFAEIEAVLREDFGEDAFVRIDPEPLATASIAQTHRGLLATAQEVVAKVPPARSRRAGRPGPRRAALDRSARGPSLRGGAEDRARGARRRARAPSPR